MYTRLFYSMFFLFVLSSMAFSGTYTVFVESGGGGTVTATPATGETGDLITIKATANANYRFSRWWQPSTDATITNANTSTTTIRLGTTNPTIIADFAQTYTLMLQSTGNGTVTPALSNALPGEIFTIKATPTTTGYEFKNWEMVAGDSYALEPTNATTTVEMHSWNTIINAHFGLKTCPVTINTDGNRGAAFGHIRVDPTNDMAEQIFPLYNAIDTVFAVPMVDGFTFYRFVRWTVTSGAVTFGNAVKETTTVKATLPSVIQANFTRVFPLTVAAANSFGTVTPVNAGKVDSGAAISITAKPAVGCLFTGWTVESGTAAIALPSAAATTVKLTSEGASIKANFAIKTFTLTLTNDGHGTTNLTDAVVSYGAATTIFATAAADYRFLNWTIAAGAPVMGPVPLPGNSNTTVKLTSGNATVKANFKRTYALTMTFAGSGTVTPASGNVDSAAATTIKAVPAAGYRFVNWQVVSGTAAVTSLTTATTTVKLTSGNATLRANIVKTCVLTMTTDGHGTAIPASGTVDTGATVSLTATPSTGYLFNGWTVTTGTASFAQADMAATTAHISSANTTLKANFRLKTFRLTLTNDGQGSTLPADTATVTYNVAKSIAATPASDYRFLNWTVVSGTPALTSSTLAATTVKLTAGDAVLKANFKRTYTLTLSSGGSGTVTPATGLVDSGALVSIKATPATGYVFSNWVVIAGSPVITSTEAAATTVTLSGGNASIRASFKLKTFKLYMANDGHGTTTPLDSVLVNCGATTAIKAVPSPGYRFLNWSVASGTAALTSSTASATTVKLTAANATVKANFKKICVLTLAKVGQGTVLSAGTSVDSAGLLSINAAPAENYRFTGWQVVSGTAVLTKATVAATTVKLTTDAVVKAVFIRRYMLNMADDGYGAATPLSGLVDSGAVIAIKASPSAAASSYLFSGWTVSSGTATIAEPDSASTTVVLAGGDATLTANFELSLVKKSFGRRVEELPKEYALYPNAPNPFNPGTTLSFAVPAIANSAELHKQGRMEMSLTIYNAQGQLVKNLMQRTLTPGFHSVYWNGKSNTGRYVCSGTYICRIIAGQYVKQIRMNLVK